MSDSHQSDDSDKSSVWSALLRPHLNTLLVLLPIVTVGYTLAVWLGLLSAPVNVPENPGPITGFLAANIALLTYLLRRRARQNRLRQSLQAEIRQHQQILDRFLDYDDLDELDGDSFRHTTFPLEMFNSQVAEFGYLSQAEVEELSKYYADAQRFKAAIEKIDAGDGDPTRLLNLDQEQTLVKQLDDQAQDTLTELGRPQKDRND